MNLKDLSFLVFSYLALANVFFAGTLTVLSCFPTKKSTHNHKNNWICEAMLCSALLASATLYGIRKVNSDQKTATIQTNEAVQKISSHKEKAPLPTVKDDKIKQVE